MSNVKAVSDTFWSDLLAVGGGDREAADRLYAEFHDYAAKVSQGPSPAAIWLTLPFPPAVNNLFATFKGRRIPTRRYKAWREEAATELARQRPGRVAGPFIATLVFTRPDRRKRDLDGLAKALLDLLVEAGVVEDDSLAQSIWLQWSDAAPDKTAGVQLVLEAA